MIVSEIKDIEKEDTHIYYRQKYVGTNNDGIKGLRSPFNRSKEITVRWNLQ